MDYEKKYKDALERAMSIYGASESRDILTTLSTIFPELKESEDEKIRKWIIEDIRYNMENEPLNNSEYKKQAKKAIAWLEKQGEQKPFDYEHANIPQRDFAPIEPKFKVGDFIVNDYCMGRVVALTDDAYLLDTEQGIPFSCEHNVHLWTIQDARDGDMLSNGKMIVIFKHFEEPSYRQHIVAYIGLDTSGDIQITDDTWNLGIDKAKPATKEQRDTLMKAMADAGYIFNFEKKELKKIEQKPAWSEDDEKNLQGIIDEIEANKSYAEYYDIPTYDRFLNWLKFLKDRITWKPSEKQIHAFEQVNYH